MKKSNFSQKIQKVCLLQQRACTQIQNFKRNYLENYNDSEHVVKTKNAPFFMNFPKSTKMANFPPPPLDWLFNPIIDF